MPRKTLHQIALPNDPSEDLSDQKNRFDWPRLILIILLVITCALTIYFYQKLKVTSQRLAAMQQQSQTPSPDQDAQLIADISKLTVLPKNETPTIATVTDSSKLKNQPFFAGAEVGDKVLIYQTAKLAILYRPGSNKIIVVAPLTSTDTASSLKQNK